MSEDLQISSGELDQVKAIARHESQQREALQKHVETLNSRIKQLEDDRFWQLYSSCLMGINANPSTFTEVKHPKELFDVITKTCIHFAKEAVRQVGEMNKPKDPYERIGDLDKEQADGS